MKTKLQILGILIIPVLFGFLLSTPSYKNFVRPEQASSSLVVSTTNTSGQNTSAASNAQALAYESSEVELTQTNITLSASQKKVWLQHSTTFSGVLSFTDTSTDPAGPMAPLANEPVQIQRNTGNDTWKMVADATTDANGTFSVAVLIDKAASEFRAIFVGDESYAATGSQTIVITGYKASTKINYTGPKKVRAETSTAYKAHFVVYDSRVSGNPAIAGAKVDVYRRDAYGGTWTKVRTKTTNKSGIIYWRTKVSTPTNWRLVGHSTNNSNAAKLHKVQPRVIPKGKVHKLPSAAPKPQRLAPQPAAVGSGAHPVVKRIPDKVWKSMVGKSWHSGCPVGRSSLYIMYVNYWGFDGYRHRGEIVFRSSQKSKFVSAFTKIYNHRIPLHGMYLVDKFGYSSRTNGADDYASMKHDNTSAFNCRWVDGRPGVTSPHAYGTAVDINPYENPYHSAQGWTPNYWWRAHHVKPYTWRGSSDQLVKDMRSSGFHWTYGNEDSQHFDT